MHQNALALHTSNIDFTSQTNKTVLNVKFVERLYLYAGIFIVLIAFLFQHSFSGILNDEQNSIFANLDVQSVFFGVLFSLINLHSWKIFVELYTGRIVAAAGGETSYQSSAWLATLAMGVSLKASAIVLFVWYLVEGQNHQVFYFLASFVAYLLLGTFLLGISFLLESLLKDKTQIRK